MGIEIWESTDGLTFEKVPGKTPAGADPTLVRTTDGWRMYFTEMSPGGPGSGKGKFSTAISKDGLDWVIESDTGIVQETAQIDKLMEVAQVKAEELAPLATDRTNFGAQKEKLYGENSPINLVHGPAYMLKNAEQFDL